MLRSLFSCFNGKKIVLVNEPNQPFYSELEQLSEIMLELKNQNARINMGVEFYELDDISDTYFHHLMTSFRNKMIQFLHDYQNVLFSKLINTSDHLYQPKCQYLTVKKIKQNETNTWFERAIEYVLQNRKKILPKLLKLFSFLDCHYQYPVSFTMKRYKEYTFKETSDPRVFRNDYGDTHTLEEIIGGLITYEEGLYNDTEDTRHWGLYDSSFYNVILLELYSRLLTTIESEFPVPSQEEEEESKDDSVE